jgi:type IV secretion system protein VirB9
MVPSIAMAQPTVPALETSQAAASTGGHMAPAQPPNGPPKVALPSGMPPVVQSLSPSAPLNSKEKASARMAETWRDRREPPVRGADGVLLWTYGESLPSIVCAPLQVCDFSLEAGEVLNNIDLGDKVRWSVMPATSGAGSGQVTHLVIKPQDAGLVTSMLVYTNRRIYSIKLISTQHQWTPLTAFSYPEEDQQKAWEQYRANASVSGVPASDGIRSDGGSVDPAKLDFGFAIGGGAPPWRPDRVYTDGMKTYIHFPHAMRYGDAPSLVGLNRDGNWFSDPSEQTVNYRTEGELYVVDKVLDRAELVMGVGGAQQKVTITRAGKP